MERPTKKTKIVATLGPASNTIETISALIENGANLFRLNFSHGTHDQHHHAVELIRRAATGVEGGVGILADLQGPKIRTGQCEGDETITLKRGTEVCLTRTPEPCTNKRIYIDYPNLAREIHEGARVLINDGAVTLKVNAADPRKGEVYCEVVRSGEYSSRKGVNLPNVDLAIPSLTDKDLKDLAFMLTLDIQYIALSFVRRASDVGHLRDVMGNQRPEVKIIAKIEKPEAAQAIDDILDIADGIMVARGDLGVEVAPYDVPVLQKNLIRKASRAGKPVIVATQMLESMIKAASPTRAESTDVANAIFDGADAVMLSGETAVGAYPVEAVRMMTDIAEAAEGSTYFNQHVDVGVDKKNVSTKAVCDAAARASAELSNAPICVFTLSGDTALYLSKLRIPAPIFSFSPNRDVVDALSLAFNVTAYQVDFQCHIDDLASTAQQRLIHQKRVAAGDYLVLVSGTTPVRGATNYMQVRAIP